MALLTRVERWAICAAVIAFLVMIGCALAAFGVGA